MESIFKLDEYILANLSYNESFHNYDSVAFGQHNILKSQLHRQQ